MTNLSGWGGTVDKRTFSRPSGVSSKELVLVPEEELCPWQRLRSNPASCDACPWPWPSRVQGSWAEGGGPHTGLPAQRDGESAAPQATRASVLRARMPDGSMGRPWLPSAWSPPRCGLASRTLSRTAAADRLPTALLWDASGTAGTLPRAEFSTTNLVPNIFPTS